MRSKLNILPLKPSMYDQNFHSTPTRISFFQMVENSIIEMRNAASNPLKFNHLK